MRDLVAGRTVIAAIVWHVALASAATARIQSNGQSPLLSAISFASRSTAPS